MGLGFAGLGLFKIAKSRWKDARGGVGGPVAALLMLGSAQAGSISLTDAGTYTEGFDSLISVGSSSLLPPGWQVNETGANADGAYAADNGSNVAGDTYSYGSVMANRALGSVASLSLQTSFGAGFVNSTGSTITSLSVQYFGEEWRRGTAADDSLAFSYAIGTDLITGAGFTLAPI